MGSRSCRFLIAGVAAIAACLLFIAPGSLRLATYDEIGLFSLAGLLLGTRRRSSSVSTPWMFVAVGLACFVAGDVAHSYYAIALHRSAPGASIVDAFYLGGDLVLALACSSFRRSLGGKDRDAFIDAGITAISGAIIMWALVLATGVSSDSPVLQRIVTDLYPLCDVVLLGVLVRLALVPVVRPIGLSLMMGGVGLLLLGDAGQAFMQQGSHQAANFLDATWLLAYVVLAAASLVPETALTRGRDTEDLPQLSWRRILLLGTALLVGPIVTLLRDWGWRRGASDPIAFASAALAFLVLWRIASATRERQRAESHLTFLGLHDGLTRLPNRALLCDRLELALVRGRRTEGVVAVIALSLDGFELVNSSLGHGIGDQLLVEAGARLQLTVRPEDTVARSGGARFFVLAEDVGSNDDARALAERFRLALAAPFRLAEQDVFVSARSGIALSEEIDTSAQTLLQRADAAMDRAKRSDHDHIEFFDAHLQEVVTTHLSLSSDLHTALEHGELVLHYQPLVDLQSEEMAGAEALIRWQHPQKGLLAPGQFLPIAESSGLLIPVGAWVLETAFAQLATWQASVRRFAGMDIAVNVSAVHLVQPGFARDVAAALQRSGLDPRFVILEITEGVLLNDRPAALRAMQELNAMGVRIALDDFGTGYSSLSYLLRFPVDVLKIDASFVKGLGIDAEATTIVGSIVALGRTLQLDVVAEGVETKEQFQHLKRMGCPFAQGYYIGRPTPPEELLSAAETWEGASTRDSVNLALSDLAAHRS
jgi:diguanylate cyclase (GGDEF)-like protein